MNSLLVVLLSGLLLINLERTSRTAFKPIQFYLIHLFFNVDKVVFVRLAYFSECEVNR